MKHIHKSENKEYLKWITDSRLHAIFAVNLMKIPNYFYNIFKIWFYFKTIQNVRHSMRSHFCYGTQLTYCLNCYIPIWKTTCITSLRVLNYGIGLNILPSPNDLQNFGIWISKKTKTSKTSCLVARWLENESGADDKTALYVVLNGLKKSLRTPLLQKDLQTFSKLTEDGTILKYAIYTRIYLIR